jgi:hypothetical protein
MLQGRIGLVGLPRSVPRALVHVALTMSIDGVVEEENSSG